MNAVSNISTADVLGFFELDDSGVVRYSSSSSLSAGDHSIVGQNFFDQAAFRNRDELRQKFRRFVESREAADIFSFDCFLNDSVFHTKVTLTRAFETDYFPPERIVMVLIRESAG